MRRVVLGLMLALCAAALGQSPCFDQVFADSTLRVGLWLDARNSSAKIDTLILTDYWPGRRVNLTRRPQASFLHYELVDSLTADTLYVDSKYVNVHPHHPSPAHLFVPAPRRSAALHLTVRDMYGDTMMVASVGLDATGLPLTPAPRQPVVLREAADPERCMTIAMVAEGYTARDMPKFYDAAQTVIDTLLAQPGFAEMASALRVVAIPLESPQSGISRPSQGLRVRSALGSHFDSASLDRLLTIPRSRVLADSLGSYAAATVMVLANTDTYGGSGAYNEYCIGYAHGPWSPQVIVHELGHSLINLADEYESGFVEMYDSEHEPMEANITTRCDFSGKWGHLIDTGEASLIEGAGYQSHGVWRGCEHCLMRSVTDLRFCPVCADAIRRHLALCTK